MIELMEKFVQYLEQIPDEHAEIFPAETIDYLKEEYLSEIG